MKYDNVTHTYKASINVTATRDFVKDGDHLHELAFRPIADNPNNPMWGGYVVPPVQVNITLTRAMNMRLLTWLY